MVDCLCMSVGVLLSCFEPFGAVECAEHRNQSKDPNHSDIKFSARNHCHWTRQAHQTFFVNPYPEFATTRADLPREYPLTFDLGVKPILGGPIWRRKRVGRSTDRILRDACSRCEHARLECHVGVFGRSSQDVYDEGRVHLDRIRSSVINVVVRDSYGPTSSETLTCKFRKSRVATSTRQ